MITKSVFTVCPAQYARFLMIIVNYLQQLILRTFEDMERQQILEVLEKNGWRITGRGRAAEIQGLRPSTLKAGMHKLGIVRPETEE
jgi:transcriptional regulator with GAF, ATPase, and Fis domain